MLLFTNTNQKGFSIPANNCKEGSAWHDWKTQGAYYTSIAGKNNACENAHTFAKGVNNEHFEGSNAYLARKRAFIEGINL